MSTCCFTELPYVSAARPYRVGFSTLVPWPWYIFNSLLTNVWAVSVFLSNTPTSSNYSLSMKPHSSLTENLPFLYQSHVRKIKQRPIFHLIAFTVVESVGVTEECFISKEQRYVIRVHLGGIESAFQLWGKAKKRTGWESVLPRLLQKAKQDGSASYPCFTDKGYVILSLLSFLFHSVAAKWPWVNIMWTYIWNCEGRSLRFKRSSSRCRCTCKYVTVTWEYLGQRDLESDLWRLLPSCSRSTRV